MHAMDAKIEALLCERCRPIMAAALEYETAQALAKAKRDALNARIAAHDPAAKRIGKGAARKAGADYEDVPLDAPLPTRADAIATARQRIGLAWRENAKGKAHGRAGAGNAQYKHQVTEAELMRCIRGEVAASAVGQATQGGRGHDLWPHQGHHRASGQGG